MVRVPRPAVTLPVMAWCARVACALLSLPVCHRGKASSASIPEALQALPELDAGKGRSRDSGQRDPRPRRKDPPRPQRG
jgi:hypothetical protein